MGSELGSMAGNLIATGDVGTGGFNPANPAGYIVGSMMQGQSSWTNPYSGYIEGIGNSIAPLVGSVLAAVLEGFMGNTEKNSRSVMEQYAPIGLTGEQRVQTLKAQGYTDYDIYNLAKTWGMYSDTGPTVDPGTNLYRPDVGKGSMITGIYTPQEQTARSNLTSYAAVGSGPVGWVYDPNLGWTSHSAGEGMWTGENTNSAVGWDEVNQKWVDPFAPVYQQETPSYANPDLLLGNPNRKVTDFTKYIGGESSGLGDYAGPGTSESRTWEQYYNDQMFGQSLSQFLNSNPLALYDWAATHPGESLPEGVQAPKISQMTDWSNPSALMPQPSTSIRQPAYTGISTLPEIDRQHAWGDPLEMYLKKRKPLFE